MCRARNRLSASSGFPLPSLMIFAGVTIADFALTVSVAYPTNDFVAGNGIAGVVSDGKWKPYDIFYHYIINQFVEN